MRLPRFLYWIFLLYVFASMHSLQGDSTIIGTVVDSTTSSPIPLTLVKAIRGYQIRYLTFTGFNGRYILPDVRPFNYSLVFKAIGYQTLAIGVNPRNNQISVVDVSLVPIGGTISGTVINSTTSLPIAGATVYIFQNNNLIDSETTDAGGVYTANDLAPGTYTVLATASDFQGQIRGSRVLSGLTTTTDFSLSPDPGMLSGQVTDALTSIPLPDAQVAVFKDSVVVGFGNTDANGNYTIPGLAPDNYVVIASREDYQTQALGAQVFSNTTTPLNISLSPFPGTIAGKVIDANTSIPIPGASVSFFQDLIFIGSILTDINGDYEFPLLAPGDYNVIAQANNYQSAISGASVSANNMTIVNFSLATSPGAISGTIIDANTTNPIPGASILVFSGSNLIAFEVSDDNGDYTVPNLAPGTYIVLVRVDGYRAAFAAVTVVAGATTVADFSLDSNPGSVMGHISNLCNGSAVSGALVVVREGSVIVGFTLTDKSGNFLIKDLPPGDFNISVSKRNFITNSATVTVFANASTTVNLSLTPAALPPEQIFGKLVKNQFSTQTERIHAISWTSSPGSCVIGYEILRNGIPIAFVSASDPLNYLDHNRKSANIYTVRTINSFGLVSSGINITVPSN